MESKIDLDKLNNERVETTKKRVAHAILLTNHLATKLADYSKVTEFPDLDEQIHVVGKAVCLLETAVEEMEWACKHFGWDEGVCCVIDDAIKDFGNACALATYEEDPDVVNIGCMILVGITKLSKALGTLIVWFDDDVKVEDI